MGLGRMDLRAISGYGASMRPAILLFLAVVAFPAWAPPHPMRTAFERAIAIEGDDHLPKLVYSDWLDENDDPNRAEFVRAQVALLTLPADAPERAGLEERSRTLLEAHRAEWFPAVPGLRSYTLRGGFIDSAIVERAEDIAAVREAFPTVRTIQVRGTVDPVEAPVPALTAADRRMMDDFRRVMLRRGRTYPTKATSQIFDFTSSCPNLLKSLFERPL